jgi:hypothetical protein
MKFVICFMMALGFSAFAEPADPAMESPQNESQEKVENIRDNGGALKIEKTAGKIEGMPKHKHKKQMARAKKHKKNKKTKAKM